jgi:hypothetical protein
VGVNYLTASTAAAAAPAAVSATAVAAESTTAVAVESTTAAVSSTASVAASVAEVHEAKDTTLATKRIANTFFILFFVYCYNDNTNLRSF